MSNAVSGDSQPSGSGERPPEKRGRSVSPMLEPSTRSKRNKSPGPDLTDSPRNCLVCIKHAVCKERIKSAIPLTTSMWKNYNLPKCTPGEPGQDAHDTDILSVLPIRKVRIMSKPQAQGTHQLGLMYKPRELSLEALKGIPGFIDDYIICDKDIFQSKSQPVLDYMDKYMTFNVQPVAVSYVSDRLDFCWPSQAETLVHGAYAEKGALKLSTILSIRKALLKSCDDLKSHVEELSGMPYEFHNRSWATASMVEFVQRVAAFMSRAGDAQDSAYEALFYSFVKIGDILVRKGGEILPKDIVVLGQKVRCKCDGAILKESDIWWCKELQTRHFPQERVAAVIQVKCVQDYIAPGDNGGPENFSVCAVGPLLGEMLGELHERIRTDGRSDENMKIIGVSVIASRVQLLLLSLPPEAADYIFSEMTPQDDDSYEGPQGQLYVTGYRDFLLHKDRKPLLEILWLLRYGNCT